MGSLSILTVLALFLYITLSESCNFPTASLLGKRFRFESKNYRHHYFRHRGYQMWKDRYSSSGLYYLDSAFDIVPGLAGVGVSFRSVNYPNHFIRHSGFKCYIHRSDGKPLFRNEATFIPRVGLADTRGVSFESVNYPGYFIRHRGSRVQINRIDGSHLFRLDATWFPRQLKGFSVKSQWLLVVGSHYSRKHISFDKMEGLEVGNRYSTSYGINTENSWKDAIEGGNFASIGCSIKAMFKRLRSARVTGDSSWTKVSKRGTTYINIYKPTFIWQLYLYGFTSEGTLIISKTNIYRQTTSNRPPRPYLSIQTDTALSDGKAAEETTDMNDKDITKVIEKPDFPQMNEKDGQLNDEINGGYGKSEQANQLDESDDNNGKRDQGSQLDIESDGGFGTEERKEQDTQLNDEHQGIDKKDEQIQDTYNPLDDKINGGYETDEINEVLNEDLTLE